MPRRSTRRACAVLWCALLAARPSAHADVPPPELWECRDKSVGDPCDAGECKASTCSKLDYSQWDRDAEAAPPTVTYDCTLCVASDASVDGGSPVAEGDSGCGSCSTSRGDLGLRGASLGFAVFLGLWLSRLRFRARS